MLGIFLCWSSRTGLHCCTLVQASHQRAHMHTRPRARWCCSHRQGSSRWGSSCIIHGITHAPSTLYMVGGSTGQPLRETCLLLELQPHAGGKRPCVAAGGIKASPGPIQGWKVVEGALPSLSLEHPCFDNMTKSGLHYIKLANQYCFSSVLEFVCLPWSEVCSARVTSLLLLLLLL